MGKLGLFLTVFKLLYLTNYILGQSIPDKNAFFRKHYKYFESTKSFYKIHPATRTWFDAKKRCGLEGALLWHPEDQAEVDIIIGYWNDKLPKKDILHIGLTDLLSEGYWETVDGKRVDDVWHNWAEFEPNNAGGVEHCAVMIRNSSKPGGAEEINDTVCGTNQPFICKKTLASVDWNVLCDIPDKKYVYVPKLGKCYKFHKKITTWTEAYSVCAAEQSYLAVINSKEEKDFLVKMTADAHTEKIPWSYWDIRQVHVGFHRRFGDNWQTVTGQPLQESGYLVWAPNQPDNLDNEQCGSMFLSGEYNDYKCDKFAFSICEHDIDLLGNMIDERLGTIY